MNSRWGCSWLASREPGDPDQEEDRHWAEMDARYEEKKDTQILERAEQNRRDRNQQ